MQYMLLIYSNEADFSEPSTPEAREAMMAPWVAYNKELREAGVFVAGDALVPTSSATTVTKYNVPITVTDGPFAETKEQLGGYYLLDCADLDAALGWAKKCPGIEFGKVEVRPVADLGM